MQPSGLFYQDNVITHELEQDVISWLDQQPWSTKLKRRTQHYGYEYDYTKKNVSHTSGTPITGPLKTIADWLSVNGVMTPTQCIVNEYTRDQSISAHTDSTEFGPIVVSISLLQPCNMIFTKDREEFKMTLMPRSIVILTGDARYNWKHQIPSRKTVTIPDGSTYRKPDNYRRISLTYRTLNM